MAATMMSVNLSLITINENEVTKRLASYAALVAVPTMIAGVYGMNFDNMPELGWRWGYPAALGSMVHHRSVPRVSLPKGGMVLTIRPAAVADHEAIWRIFHERGGRRRHLCVSCGDDPGRGDLVVVPRGGWTFVAERMAGSSGPT